MAQDEQPVARIVRLRARIPSATSSTSPECVVSDDQAVFLSVRNWLLEGDAEAQSEKQNATLSPRVSRARLTPSAPFWPQPHWSRALRRATRPQAPPHAVVLEAGLRNWTSPAFERWLDGRPDLAPISLLSAPWEFQFPEYAVGSQADDVERACRRVIRKSRALIASSAVAATTYERLGASRNLAIEVEGRPSELAGSSCGALDRDLAAVPYFVAFGAIEARANTLLLLQIWRDLAASRPRLPKLVLVGLRGAQVDQIAPMLDWGATIRPHVRETPALEAENLRRLIVHSRGVLAPAFIDRDGALLRDARAMGVNVIASDNPVYQEALGRRAKVLDPLDGLAWRAAILRAAAAEPRRAGDVTTLMSWGDWRERIQDRVAAVF